MKMVKKKKELKETDIKTHASYYCDDMISIADLDTLYI